MLNLISQELDEQGIQMHGKRLVDGGYGHIFIRFDDVREACAAHASSRLSRKNWKVEFANPVKLPKVVTPQAS